MSYRIDGFKQISSFYHWVFENPDKVRPTHISLYLFLWNHNNNLMWCEWFKCPYELAMNGACIGNNKTYYNCLDDLQKWNLIDYVKGKNNFKSPLIRLKLLYDNVQQPAQLQIEKYTELMCESVQVSVQQPAQQYAHIYNYITNNIIIINDNFNKVEKFICDLSKEKIKPDWKKDFNVYLKNLNESVKEILLDKEWLESQEYIFPKYDIVKTIERSYLVYWSTEDGWKNKKSKKSTDLNWKSTFTKTMEMNKVYKEKQTN